MSKKEILLQLLPAQGLLPLYFYEDETVTLEVLKALYRAGIRLVEYTNRGEAALRNFSAMRALCDTDLKGMYLGAGTIKNAEQAKQFMDAGADFIISPGLVPEVATVTDGLGSLWIPGCMTATEIIDAENAGARFIKLFPGNLLKPGFMEAIKDLFPGLKFMPTGGVDISYENLSAWFKAGVAAVGMGSKLISKELLSAKDYAGIEALTKEVMGTIYKVRNTNNLTS